MAFLFEKLEVYQRAIEFDAETRRVCARLPGGNGDIADQLRRAAVSVPANIAEGNGRWHGADKRHFLMIARGSAFECVALLEILSRTEAISREECGKLKAEINSLAQMINGLSRRFAMAVKA